MSLTEQIESVQWLGQRFEFGARPRLDAFVLMRRTQHEVRTIGFATGSKRRAKRRRNGYATLGVQPVLVGAEEIGHPSCRASPAGRLAEPMRLGEHGIAWEKMGVQGNSRPQSSFPGLLKGLRALLFSFRSNSFLLSEG